MSALYGIRYATLTNGQRFDLPRIHHPETPHTPIRGEYSTSDGVPVFPQLPSRLEEHMGGPGVTPPQTEDAFFLNIFTPTTPGPDPLPVMIFIHGGAWVSGAGSWPWYDGSALAEYGVAAPQGAVVVNVNYRIHAVGHVNEDDIHLPLEDLVCAVQWVQQHIDRVGGDPHNVTLVGQSAGGWYVHALAQRKDLRGSFRKIAMLSMGTRTPWSPEYKAELRQRIQDRHNGQDLRTLPVKDLMLSSLQENVRLNEERHGPRPLGVAGSALLPSVSENLPEHFLDPATAAKNLVVDEVFFRYTTDETGIFFATSEPELNATSAAAEQVYTDLLSSEDMALLPEHLHARMTDPSASAYERLRAISSWVQFQKLPHQLMAAYEAAGKRVQLHEFGFASPNSALGACHCLDLPFQFGQQAPWSRSPMLEGISGETFARVSTALMEQLLGFVTASE